MIVPKHVAIIMDGNRRWAKKHGQAASAGHVEGEKRIEPIIDTAIKMGISTLTFWAFSTENWHRKEEEVDFLLSFMRKILEKKIDNFHLKNVRVRFIGDLSKFSSDIQESVRQWMEKTKNNKKITVNIALNYGGRDEILRAIIKFSNQLFTQSNNEKDLERQFNNLTMERFGNFLDTANQPDPDLLIRTGGEKRLSGFMLWQLEYTELYFTDILWPDFTPEEFQKAIEDYQHRIRRFGR